MTWIIFWFELYTHVNVIVILYYSCYVFPIMFLAQQVRLLFKTSFLESFRCIKLDFISSLVVGQRINPQEFNSDISISVREWTFQVHAQARWCMGFNPSWSTVLVPGQLGLLQRETLSHTHTPKAATCSRVSACLTDFIKSIVYCSFLRFCTSFCSLLECSLKFSL